MRTGKKGRTAHARQVPEMFKNGEIWELKEPDALKYTIVIYLAFYTLKNKLQNCLYLKSRALGEHANWESGVTSVVPIYTPKNN